MAVVADSLKDVREFLEEEGMDVEGWTMRRWKGKARYFVCLTENI